MTRLPARLRAATPAIRRSAPLDARDAPWLALALVPGVVAAAVYLATNPYPAYGAGLYAQIAGEIVARGYAPPATVPGYTAEGVPFAYPPLQLYVYAALLDLGFGPVAVARWLPCVGVLAGLVPIYLLGRDVAGSRPAGTAAAALVALNPQVLEWHISAGGVVRAFAFCYAIVAIYAGYRRFDSGIGTGIETGDGVALRPSGTVAVGIVAFGLTVLSHPVYSLFVVASYLVFWTVGDRSREGFVAGLAVGLGGAALAAPWLGWALATHGADAFAAAAGTHGGVGGGTDALSVGVLAAAPAVAYLLARREWLLPAWLLVAELLFRQPRFAYAVLAVLVPSAGVAFARSPRATGLRTAVPGVGLLRAVLPDVGSLRSRPGGDGRVAAAAVLVLAATALGGGAFAYDATAGGDSSTPAYLDADDAGAMAWIDAETPPDATFVAVGDAAEWLPALADRTLLVGPWGVEWVGPAAFERQLAAFEAVSTCGTADCVERAAADVPGGPPTHVYVPRGQYTILGDPAVQSGALERSFERSDDWERAYENDGVAVFAAVGNASAD